MRLIDADEYEKRIKPYDTEDVIDKALYNFAHEKLITTPTAQPSYTDEEVQKMQELEQAELEKAFELGREEGRKEAQPKRKKKGKWLPDNNNYYEERFICSVCGRSYKVDTCMGKPMWDFCPCGADMRAE